MGRSNKTITAIKHNCDGRRYPRITQEAPLAQGERGREMARMTAMEMRVA